MIQDQQCLTNPSEAALFVSALGEVHRGQDVLACSSVDLNLVQKKYGFTVEEMVEHKMGTLPPGRDQAINAAIEEEFAAKRKDDLTESEHDFVLAVYAVQNLVDFGRFRVYGQLNQDASRIIVLCAEFIGLVDNYDLWERISAIAAATSANVWIMNEAPNRDHSYRNYPKGHPEAGKKIPGSDVYGPNHGKEERQVELAWRVDNQAPDTIKAMIASLKTKTQSVWDTAGVGVM